MSRKISAVAATTNPVWVNGRKHHFKVPDLILMQKQVANSFIPINQEHLSFLPPLGRWSWGELRNMSDGHIGLVLHGEEMLIKDIPSFVINSELRSEGHGVRQTQPMDEVFEPHIILEPRNYEPEMLAELKGNSYLRIREAQRWASLPPIEISIVVSVAAMVANGFLNEAGADLYRWIKRALTSTKNNDRNKIVSLVVDMGSGRSVTGYILLDYERIDMRRIERAFAALNDLAAFAASHELEDGEFVDLNQACFIFDEDEWHLAWWTDSRSILVSEWYRNTSFDLERFLGHEPINVTDIFESRDSK